MSLPRFIVIKSNYNERYLGFVPPEEFKDIDQGVAPSRDSFLRFDQDEVNTTRTKFKVEPAKIGNDLVHLKSCHNNKYWVRWSPRHWWIVAAADKPEEDRTKWSCTLFRPIYVDRNENTVRFLHVQLGHYACLWRIDLPFGYCLFGGSKDPDNDSCDLVTVIDWETLSTSSAGDQDDYNRPVSLPRNGLPNAIAYLRGEKSAANGTIAFSQRDTDAVTMIIRINKIPYQFHAIHIKSSGDISGGIASAGHTFCHLGNFESDTNDKLETIETTTQISLLAEGEDSIIGRTIVVYAKPNPTLGFPLAWGVIGHTA